MLSKLIWSRRNAYLFVTFLLVTSLLSKFFFNGLIYGLDFSLYHPDGTLYTFRTLDWLGYSQKESAQLISDWYANYAGKMKLIDPASLYYDSNPNWQLYRFRILYSFLCTPFVYLFGIKGMLIIPALSFLGMLLVLLEIGYLLKRVPLALLIIFLLTISPTITRWMFINTTDSLFTFLATLSTFLLIKWSPKKSIFFSQIMVLVAMILTRVAVFYAIPLIGMLYFKSKKQAGLLFAVVFVTLIPLFFSKIQNTIGVVNSSGSLSEKLSDFFLEVGQLYVLDRILFTLVFIGLLLALRNYHSSSSIFLLVSMVSTYAMSLLNGTIGVNFRFQLSIIGALYWVLLVHTPKIKRVS
jgi:hypothetical protein